MWPDGEDWWCIPKDCRHTTLAAGPWLALRLRLESVEAVGSFWTMRLNEERTQAAGRTRNNGEEENTQWAELPTANCQGDRLGQRETISEETCISQLGGPTTVGTPANINKHLVQLPTHQVFTSQAGFLSKNNTERCLSLLSCCHKINFIFNSLITFVPFYYCHAPNGGINFKTTHRESSCLKWSLSDGPRSLVYHTCSSCISLWKENTRKHTWEIHHILESVSQKESYVQCFTLRKELSQG